MQNFTPNDSGRIVIDNLCSGHSSTMPILYLLIHLFSMRVFAFGVCRMDVIHNTTRNLAPREKYLPEYHLQKNVFICLFIFLIHHSIPWRDLIPRPIPPIFSPGRDDTTRPGHQGTTGFLFLHQQLK
jgi:hypothetical protein